VLILPPSVWVNQIYNPQRQVSIHPALQSISDAFQESYKAKFKNRNLNFITPLGSVSLIYNKKDEIICSPI
jgi:hypothetical protein